MTQGTSPILNSQAPVGADRLWLVGPGRVAGVIHGPLPNKSNSKQIVMIPAKRDPSEISAPAFEAVFLEALREMPEDPRARVLLAYEKFRRGFTDAQHKRPLVIKSKEARDYDTRFGATAQACPDALVALDGALWFKATVYQANLLRDLDCELLPDLLQKYGVIRNDRKIWDKKYRREISKVNPRVEFQVGVWADGERA